MYANSTLKHISHAEPSHLSHQKIPNKTNACHVKGEAFARCSGSGDESVQVPLSPHARSRSSLFQEQRGRNLPDADVLLAPNCVHYARIERKQLGVHQRTSGRALCVCRAAVCRTAPIPLATRVLFEWGNDNNDIFY